MAGAPADAYFGEAMLWIILILVVLGALLLVILDSDVARALASRRRGARVPEEREDGVRQRLDRLEGDVERLSEEVRRLEEESRFLHDLLSERSRDADRLPRRDEGR